MKMEVMSSQNLLRAYINQHYANTNVLVIYQNNFESVTEFNALMNNLETDGFGPPHQFRGAGYLFIEMQDYFAKPLIEKHHSLGCILMEYYVNGKPVYDNFGKLRDPR